MRLVDCVFFEGVSSASGDVGGYVIVRKLVDPLQRASSVHTLVVNSSIPDSDVNNQQDATNFSFINLFNSALHVSGDKFSHPQEHFLTVYIQLLVHCTDTAADRCHG